MDPIDGFVVMGRNGQRRVSKRIQTGMGADYASWIADILISYTRPARESRN